MKINKTEHTGCKPGDWVDYIDYQKRQFSGIYIGIHPKIKNRPCVVDFDHCRSPRSGTFINSNIWKISVSSETPEFSLIGIHHNTPIIKKGKHIWAGCTKLDKGLVEKILASYNDMDCWLINRIVTKRIEV